MRTRIKVHPIEYVPIKGKRIQNVSNGRYIRRHQTIKLKNGTVKTIYHTEPSVKRGRTLGDIYWDDVLNNPNYEAYQNKFRKREKTL